MSDYYFSFLVDKEIWQTTLQVSREEGVDLNAIARTFFETGFFAHINQDSSPPPDPMLCDLMTCESCEE